MIAPKIKWILIVLFVVLAAGCSSTNTSDEDALMDMESESSSEDVGSLEDEIDAADAGSEDGDFTEDSGGESTGGEDDEFADFGEDFAEDSPEDSFGDEEGDLESLNDDPFSGEDAGMQEELAAQDEVPLEEQMAEEPQFEEPLDPEPVEDSIAAVGGGLEISGAAVDIMNIRFLANENGGTIVIVGSGPLSHTTRVNSETNQFVVEIQNANLPDRLKRPFILKEFPQASFGAINAYQEAGSGTVRIVVQMKAADFNEPVVQPEGNTLIVIPSGMSEAPVIAEEEASEPEGIAAVEAEESELEESIEEAEVEEIPGADDVAQEQQSYDVASAMADEKALGSKTLNEFLTGNNKFYGRPISIQVKDADIRDVLSFIAGESGTNMILADQVQGKITLKLREIPWDQALVTVMKAKGLGYIREGSVIRINSLQELEKEANDARRIVEAQKSIEPLKVKVMPVSFARVSDLSGQVQPFLSPGRGSVVYDERTSSLIVTDTDEVLKKAERLVRELDVAPAQVIIEGKIVEAVETFNRTLGINWSASGTTMELANSGGLNNGPINLTQSIGVSNMASDLSGQFNLDMQVGTLEFLGNLKAQLRLAENDELVNIVSSPRVVTMNKQTAVITQDSEIVSLSTTADEGVTETTIVRTPVIVSLNVTPQITADGSVIMDINVRREFAGAILDAESLARPVNKRSAQTRVLVKNGATAVIGGMYNSTETRGEVGVPLLRKIPVIGWLFKTRTTTNEKNELLIFLTPRILNLQDQNKPVESDDV